MADKSPDFEDVLVGVQAIADYVGEPYKRVYYKLTQKHIPGWQIGQIWYSTKSKLRACYHGDAA
jgi:hypothetical protein